MAIHYKGQHKDQSMGISSDMELALLILLEARELTEMNQELWSFESMNILGLINE